VTRKPFTSQPRVDRSEPHALIKETASSKEVWSLLLEEYKSLRAENLAIQIECKKIIATTLASLAILVALLNYVGNKGVTVSSYWYFVLSMIYSILGIYYLRQVWYKDLISIYISTKLKSEFQKLLNANEQVLIDVDLVRWDEWQSTQIYSKRLRDKPMEAATLLIPLVPSVCLSGVGVVQTITGSRFSMAVTDFSWKLALTSLLGAVAVGLLLYCTWLAFDLRRRLRYGMQ
jgi:hypothetical protein